MNMFKSFFTSLPKNRANYVEEFDQSDVSLPPHIMTNGTDDSLTMSISSISTLSGSGDGYANSVTTDSSVALSKAMTDSEIDYERYRRYKNRSFSDPWDQLKSSIDAFPPGYLSSLNSFQNSSTDVSEDPGVRQRPYFNEELMRKMERFFDEECRVYTPDDPGLLDLESALLTVDMQKLVSDADSASP